MTLIALAACLLLAAGCVPGKQYKRAVTGLDSCKSELDRISGHAEECEQRLASLKKDRDQVMKNNSILVETNARLTLQVETERKDASRETGTMQSRMLECEFHVSELESALSECRTAAPEEPLLPAEVINAPADEAPIAVEEPQATEEPQVQTVSEDGVIEALYSDIYVVLRAEVDSGGMTLAIQNGVLVATVPGDKLFKTASATLTDSGENLLIKLSEAMRGYKDFKLNVGAHTDNVGLSSRLRKKYDSNWELSAARAISAARYMADPLKESGWNISATAHADSEPLAPNDSDENRARNRRLEFTVIR